MPAYAEGEGVVTYYNPSTGVYTPPAPTCDSGTLGVTSGTVDLEAMWEAIQYNIHFNGGADTSGSMEKQLVTYDTPTQLSSNQFTKAYNVFKGWTRTQNGTTVEFADGATIGTPNQVPDENLSTTETPDVELYAVWDACAQPADLTLPDNAHINISQTTMGAVSNNKCTYTVKCADGYTYSGATASNDGTSYTFETAAGQTTGTLFACSTGNSIDLTYDLDGGSSTATNTGDGGTARSCTYGGSVTLPDAAPTKTGYKFKGWKIKETPANNNQGD